MKHKRVPGGAIAGSIIIAIIMTVVLACTTTGLVVNRIFTEKFIVSAIGSIKEIEIPITVNDKEYDNISDAVSGAISDSLAESAGEEGAELSEEEINDFIEESGLEDLIAEKLGMGIEAVLADEDIALITEDDIMDFIDDNEDLIEDTFEVDITEDMKDELRDEIKESEIEDAFTTGTITQVIYEEESNPLAPVFKATSNLISTPMVIAGYVVVILMWVGVFFLNRRQIWSAGPFLGIPAAVVGAGVIVTSLVVKVFAEVVAKEFGGFIKPEMFTVLNDLLINIGVIYLIVGVVMIVVSIILTSAAKKNAAVSTDVPEELV